MNEETKLFRCNCSSMEHHFVMTYWPDDEPIEREIYVQVHLSNRSFIDRLRWGLRYIFGYHCKYGHWEEVLLDDRKAQELWEYLGVYLETTARDQVTQALRRGE